MADRKKAPEFISPRGVLRYPKIVKPDYGTKEFPKVNGEYSVQLVCRADDPAVKTFLKTLAPLHEEAVAQGRAEFDKLKIDARKRLQKENGSSGIKVNALYTELFDEQTEEPTGEIVFKFAKPATYEDKETGKRIPTKKPVLFDAKGVVVADVEPWGGTVAKIAFSARPYFVVGSGAVGLKLSLGAVQILDLVEAGQRSASSFGFEAEDGYVHTAKTADTSAAAGADDSDAHASADDDENPDF